MAEDKMYPDVQAAVMQIRDITTWLFLCSELPFLTLQMCSIGLKFVELDFYGVNWISVLLFLESFQQTSSTARTSSKTLCFQLGRQIPCKDAQIIRGHFRLIYNYHQSQRCPLKVLQSIMSSSPGIGVCVAAA